ncbi:MAG: hypothetical protein PHE80_02220, partial [Candidatus Omnitrophica bacterium]|nr:hypothetical protein [Candidatus Omnitrophota bacterium]
LFAQNKNDPYPAVKELILLYALRRNVLDVLSKADITDFKDRILGFAQKEFPSLVGEISEKKELTPEIKKSLNDCIVAFFKGKGVK